jgi:DNA sulfur modification protein DndB
MDILDRRPAIKGRIDMENASPGKLSSKLWSLVAFHTFVNLLTGLNGRNMKSLPSAAKKADQVVEFLDALDAIPMWQAMLKGNVSGPEVREQYIISHAVFLHALGVFGTHIRNTSQMEGLKNIDPNKSSTMWDGRCVIHGKMRKTTDGVKSAAAVMMRLCDITMPEDVQAIDDLCGGSQQDLPFDKAA